MCKGVAIYPTDFEPSIKKFGVFGAEYLIKVWNEGHRELVKVLVEFLGESCDRAKWCDELAKDLHGVLGLRSEVEGLPKGGVKALVGTETRTKYKRIMDLRKK